MELIVHRVNSISELKKIPKMYGVEIDLRVYDERLILQHDPFKDGEDFEEYLQYYNHGIIILNIKSERIEYRVIELLMKYKVRKYFFLDSSFPMIYLLSKQGEKNIALRFSEFEGLDTIINMRGKVNWVWVDCFSKLPIDRTSAERFQSLGYKTCLVSPDLLGRPEDIQDYKSYIKSKRIFFDAVCVKNNNVLEWILD